MRKIGVLYGGSSQHSRTYKTGEFAKHIHRLLPIRGVCRSGPGFT
nr:hypothetical protein [Planococcus glaciei]